MSPSEALSAVLAGQTVRVVVGPDPEDPILLHYLDRCFEHDYEPMIYTEAIGGWSEGIREAVCEPTSAFYVGWVADPAPLSIEPWEGDPPRRESPWPVVVSEIREKGLRGEPAEGPQGRICGGAAASPPGSPSISSSRVRAVSEYGQHRRTDRARATPAGDVRASNAPLLRPPACNDERKES